MGRRDSVSHDVVNPSISYMGINGWNGSLIASHEELPPGKKKKGNLGRVAKTPLLDELDGQVGWDHDFGEHFATSVSNIHSYFDSKSAKVRSVIDNDFNLGMLGDWDYITAAVSGDLDHGVKSKLGKGRDYFLTGVLSHEFEIPIGASADFRIEPRITMVAGTQRFYLTYTRGIPLDPASISLTEYPKQLAKFEVLNYQFAVPVTYSVHSWAFGLGWEYNMPQNIIGGASSSPYSVYMAEIKFIIRGKAVVFPKKRR